MTDDMIYSTSADPSDSYSNHVSNAEQSKCQHCGSTDIMFDYIDSNTLAELYICLDCGEYTSEYNL